MDPWSTAHATARRAGVSVAVLEDLAGLAQVDGLFRAIWGGAADQVGMPVNLLRALLHAGGYVAGATDDASGHLLGAVVAFLGVHDGRPSLHSHVAGVLPAAQGWGVGSALKFHQRAWALERGIERVTWTFDPLVRRNGWLNLTRLGARAVAYYENFYGPMEDDLNGTDDTDRCLVVWELGRAPTAPSDPPGALAVLEEQAGRPTVRPIDAWGAPISCQVPLDIAAMRGADTERAREWRLALRATMGAAMAGGYAATVMTGDGRYLLERP